MNEALPPFVESELVALALAQLGGRGVQALGPGAPLESEGSRLRAVRWRNTLCRLGAVLPLFVVHDLGLLLGTPHAELQLGGALPHGVPAPDAELGPLLRKYQALLRALLASEPVEQIAAQRPGDELVAALLYRVAAGLSGQLEPAALRPPRAELPLALLGPALLRDAELLALGRTADAGWRAAAAAWLRLLTTEPVPMQLLTAAELLDPATVRLLSLDRAGTAGPGGEAEGGLGGEAELGGLGGTLELTELVDLLGSPEVRDVVRFSLQLLPSVLEPRRASSAHSFPTGGYAALLNRGPLDAALLHELAGDEELFLHKLLHGELLYYGRDQEQHQPRRLHDVLVDVSPSMRGLRQVFARGLALALARRLLHGGAAVRVRCFDGRLYDGVRADLQPARLAPYLLSFRSQRGRNYARIFRDLGAEYAELHRGGPGRPSEPREIWTYLITHGECHVAPELLAGVRRHARLCGVFIFPSGELLQEGLPLFERVQVVPREALVSETERRARALELLDRLAGPTAS